MQPLNLKKWCVNGQKDALDVSYEDLGFTPTNPNLKGTQLNTLFNQIFGYIDFLESKGLSFWRDDKSYYATTGDIDIVREANIIYFAKQDSNIDPINNPLPKSPTTNPDFWGVLLDLDNTVTSESILGNTNIIRNWNFERNQRAYVSATATTIANQYTLDGWRVIALGEKLTFSKAAGKITATAPLNGIEELIEGALLQSGNYKVSWEGTATCTINGTARTKGEVFSIVGGANVSAKLFNGTVANFRIDSTFGAVAEELTQCGRYYWRGKALNADGKIYGQADTYLIGDILSWNTKMRATPTVTVITAPVYTNCTPSGSQYHEHGGNTYVDVPILGIFSINGGVYEASAELA